jgi:hypothetical protein
MPGSTPPTSQLDWLSSTTAMILLSWSKATRDLLKSFSWGITALRQLFASDDGAISPPPAPYHLSVPGREAVKPPCDTGLTGSKTGAELLGNRRFESISLQRGVRNEPSREVMLVSPIFRDLPILLGRVRIPVRHPQPAKSQGPPPQSAHSVIRGGFDDRSSKAHRRDECRDLAAGSTQ